MRAARSVALGFAATLAALSHAGADELSIASISAQDLNCIFDTSCHPSAMDSVSALPIAGVTGRSTVHTRTIPAGDMSRAAGKVAYLYRVNLTGALGGRCVSTFRLPFGAVEKMPYSERGPYVDAFVVVSGSLGTIGLSSADKTGNIVTFRFSKPVCAGTRPGEGESSLFFGLSAAQAPQQIWAQVDVSGTSLVGVQVRSTPVAEEPKRRSQSSERRVRKKRRP